MKINVLLVVMLLLVACSSDSAQPDNPAPAFNLVDTKGNTYSLAGYAGEKVYVKFWASWCSICLAGLEELNTLANEEQDFKIFTIVSPNYNGEKDRESFIKWVNGVEEASNIKVLLDENGTISKQYKVLAYPTSAFIDSKGNLVQTVSGHLSNEQIIEQFNTIP